MQMTTSEKIARVFEIAGYLWLVPSIISLVYPLLLSIVLIASGNSAGFSLLLIPLVTFGTGVFLLVQYSRHSRGMLDEDMIIPLWALTLVFNLLVLVPVAYGFFSMPHWGRALSDGQQIFFYGWGLLVFWLAATVLLSITAIISELWNQKYR